MTPCSDFLRFLVCVYAVYLFVVVVFEVCVCVCVTACDVSREKERDATGYSWDGFWAKQSRRVELGGWAGIGV